jgi:hypothetical protein
MLASTRGGGKMSAKNSDAAVPEGHRSGRYLRRSPEEVAHMAEGRRPFSFEEWCRKAPPATPEELAETEEFLRERELERQALSARPA